MWIWGDLKYDTSSRNSEENDPYWYGSTAILPDEFVYFVDEEGYLSIRLNKNTATSKQDI